MKIICVIISMLGIISIASAGTQDAYEKTKDSKKIGWMQKGMDAAKIKLKDPGSAQFRGVYFNRGVDGVPMTCGEVNSKNGFGGYTGFQRFISGGKPELTFMEEQVSDFSSAWNKFCQ